MQKSRYLKNLDTVIAALMGWFILSLFFRYSGVGISPDSIMYTSAARSFRGHGTLLTFNHVPIVDFPVFYPVYLGIISVITQIDPVKFGAVMNGIMFATLIFTSGWIMERFVPASRIYKWLILAAIILSPPLLQVYSYLWSETLFILEILFFIVAFREYLLKHTLKALIVAAVIAAISCVTRYAAVTIVGTGGLLLLLDRILPLKKKIVHIVIYGLICISLLVSNLVYNAFMSGTTTGPREPSITPFSQNLYYFGTVICDWMGLTTNQYWLSIPLAIIIFTGFIGALAFNYYRRRLDSFENLAITFALVYGAFIVISSTFSRYERINHRLLSPLYITALWGYTSWALLALKKLNNITIRRIIGTIMFVLMLGFITSEFLIDRARYSDQVADEYGNPGYTDESWIDSEFAAYLKGTNHSLFKPGIKIYTDAHEAVYFFSGMSSYLVPHRFFTKDIDKFYKAKHYYLIWFNVLENPELINLKDIQKVKSLKKIKDFGEEGAIYEYEE
ncbi:MAG: hypothetical protein JWQ57_2708 [Mucilaginibacter sp.]|nr:hypothetical protein [Mucilaginibacter sp.]